MKPWLEEINAGIEQALNDRGRAAGIGPLRWHVTAAVVGDDHPEHDPVPELDLCLAGQAEYDVSPDVATVVRAWAELLGLTLHPTEDGTIDYRGRVPDEPLHVVVWGVADRDRWERTNAALDALRGRR